MFLPVFTVFYLGNGRGVRGTLFACFSSFVCPIAGLHRATVKLQIFGTESVLNGSRRGLKVSPNKLH